MRRTASEKMEIIRLVEGTDLPVRATLRQLGVPRSTFYGWYQRFLNQGFGGLHDKKPPPRRRWNAIPEKVQKPPERANMPHSKSSCQKTTYRRYRKGAFFFLFPT